MKQVGHPFDQNEPHSRAMQRVYLITNAYPFYPGEQFLEKEIPVWSEATAIELVILPRTAAGQPRGVPASILVDPVLAKPLRLSDRIRWAATAITSAIFWREVRFLVGRRSPPACYVEALRSTAIVLRTASLVRGVISRRGSGIIYGYWNDLATYAAVLLKQRGVDLRVLSRAHRHDLYEHTRPHSYMPLKRQFIRLVDGLAAIADDGKQYLERQYGCTPDQVFVSRLGVSIPAKTAATTGDGQLRVVSVSACTPVKRIDKIIDALRLAADRLPNCSIEWTHIGSGPLEHELKAHAQATLSDQVKWCFAGHMSNADVLSFFSDNPVDLFINTSESEGIPVSIMEAMSFGVPAIAPDVGGVRELVATETGCLLPPNPAPPEIANAIVQAADYSKKDVLRQRVKDTIASKYSAAENYRGLIAQAVCSV